MFALLLISAIYCSSMDTRTRENDVKKILALFWLLTLVASASAEIKSIDIKIFGMD